MTDLSTSNGHDEAGELRSPVTRPRDLTGTGAIVPIRPFDEAQALDWLRGQAGGRTRLTASELGRHWGWPHQRVGRWLRAWRKQKLIPRRGDHIVARADARSKGEQIAPNGAHQSAGNGAALAHDIVRELNGWQLPDTVREIHGLAPCAVTPVDASEKSSITTGVTPFAQPRWEAIANPAQAGEQGTRRSGVDATAYMAAIALAGCAAWFSIRGMTVLFPGSPVAIVAMAATMEAAKLVTANWLARRWRATTRVWRLVLVTLVAGLAVINAIGVYAQLVSAHVGERGAAAAAIETQDAELARGSRLRAMPLPTLMHG